MSLLGQNLYSPLPQRPIPTPITLSVTTSLCSEHAIKSMMASAAVIVRSQRYIGHVRSKYRLTHCLAGIKARYSPGVGDLATDRRSSEYTVPPPRTDVIYTVPFTVHSQFACCRRPKYEEPPVDGQIPHPLANNVAQADRQGVNLLTARPSCRELSRNF